jgi:hypothetical protein
MPCSITGPSGRCTPARARPLHRPASSPRPPPASSSSRPRASWFTSGGQQGGERVDEPLDRSVGDAVSVVLVDAVGAAVVARGAVDEGGQERAVVVRCDEHVDARRGPARLFLVGPPPGRGRPPCEAGGRRPAVGVVAVPHDPQRDGVRIGGQVGLDPRRRRATEPSALEQRSDPGHRRGGRGTGELTAVGAEALGGRGGAGLHGPAGAEVARRRGHRLVSTLCSGRTGTDGRASVR